MTISSQAYERFASIPSLKDAFALSDNVYPFPKASFNLKDMFDRFGIEDGRGIYNQSEENSAAAQAQGQYSGTNVPNLTPDNISLKARIKNLISAFNPDAALYKMQTLAEQDPEAFKSIAKDVYEDLKSYGYDFHAKTLARIEITQEPDPIVIKPANDYNHYAAHRYIM